MLFAAAGMCEDVLTGGVDPSWADNTAAAAGSDGAGNDANLLFGSGSGDSGSSSSDGSGAGGDDDDPDGGTVLGSPCDGR